MLKKSLGLELIKTNFKSIALFEIIYKFIVVLLFAPSTIVILNFSMKLNGMNYLSYDNIESFITKPTSILMLAFFLIGFAIFVIFEITALVGCYHASYYKISVSVRDIFRFGIISCAKLFKGVNIFLLLLIIFIFPLLIATQFVQIAYLIKLPNILLNFINSNRNRLVFFTGLIILFSIILMRLIYAFYYFCIENCNIKSACDKSMNLIRNDYTKTVFGLILWNLVISIVNSLFLILSVLIIFNFGKALGVNEVIGVVTFNSYRLIFILLVGVSILFTLPIVFAYISSCYFNQKEDIGEIIYNYKKPKIVLRKLKLAKKIYIFIAVVLILNNFYLLFFEGNSLDLKVELFHKTSITAHRGDSANAPENTIIAIESAINHFADWVEIDLQQTKDGEIIVMHDSNLRRTTGVNKYIWDVNFDEVKTLDAGKWFGEEFSGERIPTLDEVIKLAKGKIKLNIELKPTGHEKGLEDAVVNIIKNNNFESDCVVTSLKYDIIKRIKQIDPDIKTIYVTTLAYGKIAVLPYADGFSVEHSFITKRLVNTIKNKGKDVYAWTVNNEADLVKMINLGVDNIITDDPLKAKEMVYSNYAPDKLIELVNYKFRINK
ncbi:glycerophosphodiester phosphodiesterase [Sedimentibacter sp. zth1]|uniref:glycerophosphodiester phosphodiesterase n=1 Tax=Sedimentibacter sp. zth1 TaxID=2816908 RepID=UPI001A910F6E|nr:glycerophosphodiester phosphodiesterase [Sedimentibacter sp. zth1]QSX06930.1 glycerophosphodiester phosphodiesterase [Sedimentibacter sp. zth1]